MKNKLFLIKNEKEIEILKQNGIDKFIYPLFSFCVGVEKEFKLEDIKEENAYLLINRVLDSKSINKLKSLLDNLNNNIKGIIFEDVGIIELAKNLKVEKILYYTHFACNYMSVNEYLKYVDTLILPQDITEDEIKEIIQKADKKVSLYVFGYIPSMYSRRSLVSNYAKHFNIPKTNPLKIQSGNNDFLLMENDYGTFAYKMPYYNALRLLKYDAKYYIYFPIFLSEKDLINLAKDDVSNLEYDYGFLDTKTIYKIKKAGDK